jgi:glucose-1-phosphate adenylyltransferase
MDFRDVLAQHIESGSDITIATTPVSRQDASEFGIMRTDANRRIYEFVEKPKDPPAMPGNPSMSLASMGIYVFETQFLFDELRRDAETPDSKRDFGGDIIPYIVKHGKAVAHKFTDSCIRAAEEIEEYWRDVGTLDAYFEANLDLTDVVPKLNMYDRDWRIWTDQVVAAPAKFVHDEEGRRGHAISSLISQDCIVSGATAHRSLLFTGVKMGSFSSVSEGVILPYSNIGRGARLSRVIIDSGVRIPENLVVGEDPILDAKRFRRTENGVCLITKPMIDKLIA